MQRAAQHATALMLCSLVGLSQARAEDLTIYAAASLKNVVDELSQRFESDTGHSVATSYAGSSVLARQILLGAPGDLFLSANVEWMDAVANAGRVEAKSVTTFASNQLVLVAPANSDLPRIELTDSATLLAALNGGRMAMALVEAVPAGIYGKAALSSLGVWNELAPHIAQADNVRAALALVALGETPLGIVYASDALADPRVRVVAQFPETSHPLIRYAAGVIEGANGETARAFLSLIYSNDGAKSLVQHGLIPLNTDQ